MKVTECKCSPVLSEQFSSGDIFRTPRYTFLGKDGNTLTIKVYASLPGNARFTAGAAEINNRALYLNCDSAAQDAGGTNLLAWELTFDVSISQPFAPRAYFFLGKQMEVARFD